MTLKNGAAAEQLAATWLQRQGLKLLTANYHCRFGEIDLVMRDGKQTVFVEVRLRSHGAFGGAAASITPAKQQKLIRAAEHYLMQHGLTSCRFDAVLLDELSTDSIVWLKNAFDG
ncbi:MAG: YraN family protein [Methylobacillus sp.]|nr:YraN family protein [Methylobacillus sp.]